MLVRDYPPSITKISPVMKLASSLPRKSMVFATSPGWFNRFRRGTSWADSSKKVRFYCSVKFIDSFFIRAALIVTPGATAFILTPWNDVSRAVVFTNMFNMAMEVEKMIYPG